MLSEFLEAAARIRAIRSGVSGPVFENFTNPLFESEYAKNAVSLPKLSRDASAPATS